MISDARAAQVINSTMVSLLIVLVLAASIWGAATEFPNVRVIYARLSPEEHRHLSAFLSSSTSVLVFGSIAARWVRSGRLRLKAPDTYGNAST